MEPQTRERFITALEGAGYGIGAYFGSSILTGLFFDNYCRMNEAYRQLTITKVKLQQIIDSKNPMSKAEILKLDHTIETLNSLRLGEKAKSRLEIALDDLHELKVLPVLEQNHSHEHLKGTLSDVRVQLNDVYKTERNELISMGAIELLIGGFLFLYCGRNAVKKLYKAVFSAKN